MPECRRPIAPLLLLNKKQIIEELIAVLRRHNLTIPESRALLEHTQYQIDEIAERQTQMQLL